MEPIAKVSTLTEKNETTINCWLKDLNIADKPASAIRSMDSMKKFKSLSPPDFMWVDKGWLAGCSTPSDITHYRYLSDEGIRHLISLGRERARSHIESVDFPRFNRINIRISEKRSLTVAQIDGFIDIVEQANNKKEVVAVHSAEGSKQIGILLACYLIKTKRISSDVAVRQLNAMRPQSITTDDQQRIIKHYYLFWFRPFKLR